MVSALQAYFLKLIYFWLCWVFVAALGLSLVVARSGRVLSGCTAQTSHCSGFSSHRAWAPGHTSSIVVVYQLSCLMACEIFPDQGSNPCPLHWQLNFQPVDHHRSLQACFIKCQTHYNCSVNIQFSSVQFSRSVVSDSLRPHEPQQARPPCPSPTPGVHSNPCSLSRWCRPTISSCHPLLLLPSIFPSIRVSSKESALHIRWPKYWSFSFNISPSNEHPGLISFRMDWCYLPCS